VAEEGQPGWTQTAPIGGTRTVTVHAIPLFNRGGGTTLGGGERVRGIEFGNQQTGAGTRAPAFTITTPPAEAPIGQLYRYVAAVSNPDGRPLTFDLPVKPDGMVVDPESGMVVWQPTGAQAGMQNVILRVRDDRG